MSAPYGNEALHNVEDRGVNSGHRRASGKAMTRIQDDQATDRAEDLVSELKAIEFWDAVHKRNLFPFWYDQVAFPKANRKARFEWPKLGIRPKTVMIGIEVDKVGHVDLPS
jgi:hypothetical protein